MTLTFNFYFQVPQGGPPGTPIMPSPQGR